MERTITEIICKRCQATDYVKNGIVRGLQRYRCRNCFCNFTATKPRGKPAAMKALVLLLYAMGNMSFCGIGRVLQVRDVSVLRWCGRRRSKCRRRRCRPTSNSSISMRCISLSKKDKQEMALASGEC